MKLIVALLLTFSFSTHASESCPIEIPQYNLCAQLEWTDGPHWNAYSTVMLKVFTAQSADSEERDYVNFPEAVRFNPYIWMIMRHHEHGGRPVIVENVKPGHYLNSKIYFMQMPGKWQFRFKLEEERGTLFEHVEDVLEQ